MSNEQTPVATETPAQIEPDLDTFSADFFGQTEAETDKAKPVVETPVEDALNEDTHNEAEATEAEAEVDETDPEEAPEADKPKKNRFQERIDELTAKARESERKAEELERRLNESLAKATPKTPEPVAETKTGPSPDALNEDGTDKYPLGEFDPEYLRDFVKHLHEVEKAEDAARTAQQAAQAAQDAEEAALRESWNSKLAPAQERYPDFMEKGQTLVQSFSGINASYGEFLTASLMSMDNGPDVLYYLASNPTEAKSIVDGGPVKAAVAFGSLSERLKEKTVETQPGRSIRETKAPPPPPSNKGMKAGIPFTPDTDDLDAFASGFFKPK